MPKRDIMPRGETSHVAFRHMACSAGGRRMRHMILADPIPTAIASKPAAAIEVR
jgi:hypothetical protein